MCRETFCLLNCYHAKTLEPSPFEIYKFLDFAWNDNTSSNLNCSVKHEICRTRECDVAKFISALFKADLKFVSAARDHSDLVSVDFSGGEHERACDYTCAAGECFVFHTTLIRPDRNHICSAFFNNVHLCVLL